MTSRAMARRGRTRNDVKGKTTTKIIPKAFVPQTREHIAEISVSPSQQCSGGSE